MGFEQLAALKTQLAEKARQEKLAKQGGAGKGRGPRPPKPGDAKPHASGEDRRPNAAGAKPQGQSPAGKPRKKHTERVVRPARDNAARPAREPATPTDPVLLLIRKLQNRFAATFPKKPAPKVPLKIGIFEDLMAHAAELGADEAQLRAAIKTWCGGSRYWACMVEGASRIDLAGNAAGVVTAADAHRARRLEVHREKRAQQRAAAPAPAQATPTAPTADAASSDLTASSAGTPPEQQATTAEAPTSADVSVHGAEASSVPSESTVTPEAHSESDSQR
ncbi:ProQ/FinO family protein [Pararobbsia silviterrae]|uniref:ProQ/FinO domain-containing protein n=1 Tax=Pararobbsia silviterrae TaxID=1792498 RepID=A0A494Y7Q5_9BURK|nr:ProQ/FinO family protein [Pararobbsia silviterrae]RKP55950.1 hypothetical protein D7S86_12230 [Pararobbsia silviterrae]